jgi:hypothetical protein
LLYSETLYLKILHSTIITLGYIYRESERERERERERREREIERFIVV